MPSGQTQRDLTAEVITVSEADRLAALERAGLVHPRAEAVNAHRPAAITTNGSAATTSVHPAGSENSCPFSSCR